MASKLLKHTVTHYRKEEHIHEAFVKWITESHLPLALPVLKKLGVLVTHSWVNAFYILCSARTGEGRGVLLNPYSGLIYLVHHAASTQQCTKEGDEKDPADMANSRL
jgi:hypothetical protein